MQMWVRSLDWEDPLEKEMASIPVFLPGKSHRQRSLVGYSLRTGKRWTRLGDYTTTTSSLYSFLLRWVLKTNGQGLCWSMVTLMDVECILPVSVGSQACNSLGARPSSFPCSAPPLSRAVNILQREKSDWSFTPQNISPLGVKEIWAPYISNESLPIRWLRGTFY